MPTQRSTTYQKRSGIRVRHHLKNATNMQAIHSNLQRSRRPLPDAINVANPRERGKPVHRVKQISG